MYSKPFQRNTRQRKLILEELQKLTSHPTAATLYAVVRRRMPKISLGTVYRNLELLARMGMIQKLGLGCSEARFDGNTEHHDHLRCVRCGRVDDVFVLPLDLAEGTVNDWCGYTILGRRLEFLGVCPQCRSREGNSDESGGGSPAAATTNATIVSQKP
jgi:Fe2+ or Zn2+ uptake regulation protein